MSVAAFTPAGLAYFKARGIDPALAARLGVEEEAGAIVWPTIDADGRPSPRRRSLNGSGPKVRGATGASLGLWWPTGPSQSGGAVLLCEGESDALAALSALAGDEPDPDGAAAFAGRYVAAVASVPGTGFPPDRLVKAMRVVRPSEVLLAFDGDAPGEKAAGTIGRALVEAGMRERRLAIPEGDDLASAMAGEDRPAAWLAQHIVDASACAADAPAPESADRSGPFPLLTADDLLRLPPPSWLIDGLLPASGLSVLYGASGAGKSFLALDWSLCVATGLPWHGHRTEPRWVVYVAAEGRAGLGARYRAWSEARGRPDARRVRFLAEAVNLRDGAQVERVRRTLASLPERPGLLVVDTMARTMVGGDENAARDVGEFVAAVDALRAADSALIVHHTGKNGAEERGSSALRAAADLMAKVQRDGTSPRLDLTCEKLKDAAGWPPVPLRLEPSAGSCVLSLTVQAAAAHDDVRDRVLAFVVERGPASKRAVRKAVEGRNAGIDAALKALETAELVRLSENGWEACPDPSGTLGHAPSLPLGGGVRPEGGVCLRHPPMGHVPRRAPPKRAPRRRTRRGEARD